jgi:autotransporter-associated beta strand protein
VIADQTGIGGTGGNAGSWALAKTGAGTLILSAMNTYSGGTTVTGGTLDVEGRVGSVALAAGTLDGNGTTGAVSATGGRIQAGTAAHPGILTNGGVSLDSASTLSVRLDGTSAGTGYDQLAVDGPVSLGGAKLSVSLGFTPHLGQVFTVISQGAGRLVSGTFASLKQGAEFSAGGKLLQISYVGGPGHDVTLTVVPVPDGAGQLTASTRSIPHGATHQTIVFTYTTGTGGINGGAVTLVVPSGWSAPSTTTNAPGFTTTSTGHVSVSGRTISVTGLTRAPGGTVKITYGSKVHGGPGARAPSTKVGTQTWHADEKSTASGRLTKLATSPTITIT